MFAVINTGKSIIIALILTFFLTGMAMATDTVDSVPTRLIIPALVLDSEIAPVGWKPVVVNGQTYGQWLVDNNRVGWHNLSAKLGQVGNTVLNGHSDVYVQVFRYLDNAQIGDEIIAFSGDQEYRYVITQKVIVREKGVSLEDRVENAKLIAPTDDERLTLITCTQPGATHRLIVIAQPIKLVPRE